MMGEGAVMIDIRLESVLILIYSDALVVCLFNLLGIHLPEFPPVLRTENAVKDLVFSSRKKQ